MYFLITYFQLRIYDGYLMYSAFVWSTNYVHPWKLYMCTSYITEVANRGNAGVNVTRYRTLICIAAFVAVTLGINNNCCLCPASPNVSHSLRLLLCF